MTGQDAGQRCDLSYGELLRLTEGHGTGTIYERIVVAIDAAVAEAVAELANESVSLDTHEAELAEARREERERLVNIAIREGVSSYVIKILRASAPQPEACYQWCNKELGHLGPCLSRVKPASAPEGQWPCKRCGGGPGGHYEGCQ